jgi:hypothetical protein
MDRKNLDRYKRILLKKRGEIVDTTILCTPALGGRTDSGFGDAVPIGVEKSSSQHLSHFEKGGDNPCWQHLSGNTPVSEAAALNQAIRNNRAECDFREQCDTRKTKD